jgi:alpha(1,3/1,4) fucosyltransferase
MITISYINYWNDPHNDNYFTNFIKENIGPVKKINPEKNPDILIASCMGDINKVKKLKSKFKLFYYGENLNMFPPYNNDELLYDTFDLIVGFKNTDLSKKQIRFPLWLMYYDYYKYDKNDNILRYIQTKYDKNIKKQKDIFASIIVRHDRGGQRTKIFNELSKYGEIKSPGVYRKNDKSIGKTHDSKINYISRSVYNICPENSVYEGYFTEKIFQAFEGGTIPLYWAVNLPELEIINKNKYCFCNVNNEEELEKSILNVTKNRNEYIDGELFIKNAGEKIQIFYSVLLENILLHLSS